MKSVENQLNELQVALLQLQRSALIDTQTIMQIMLDKGICMVEDIIQTREKIENESEAIRQIDEQIVIHGGTIVETPEAKKDSNKVDLQKELETLKKMVDVLMNQESQP